jgi:phosphate/sulfate permease
MTGVRFLFRVTLRRLDLAAEISHIREPQKIPQVISPDEMRRLLAVASMWPPPRKVAGIRWNVASNVVVAWIVTFPAAALFGAIFYELYRFLS